MNFRPAKLDREWIVHTNELIRETQWQDLTQFLSQKNGNGRDPLKPAEDLSPTMICFDFRRDHIRERSFHQLQSISNKNI